MVISRQEEYKWEEENEQRMLEKLDTKYVYLQRTLVAESMIRLIFNSKSLVTGNLYF